MVCSFLWLLNCASSSALSLLRSTAKVHLDQGLQAGTYTSPHASLTISPPRASWHPHLQEGAPEDEAPEAHRPHHSRVQDPSVHGPNAHAAKCRCHDTHGKFSLGSQRSPPRQLSPRLPRAQHRAPLCSPGGSSQEQPEPPA